MTLHIYPGVEQREEWRPIPGHDGYEVSNLFGISQSQVSNIVRRASWSHLEAV